MSHNNLIALIMATKLEAVPFFKALSLEQREVSPFPVYSHDDIVLIISGIGKANAASATTYAVLRYQPPLICNLGAAGATGTSYKLGDNVHIDKVTEYDRPHLHSHQPRVVSPLVFPGFSTASIATQDKPVVNREEREAVGRCADLVDMEAAGVLAACDRFENPCTLFKFVSDTPDHETHHDIVAHIKAYRSSFCDFFMQAVLPVLQTNVQK